MMKLDKVFRLGSVFCFLLLSACANTENLGGCCAMKIKEPSEFSALETALHNETFKVGIGLDEIARISSKKRTNSFGAEIYVFKNKKIEEGEKLYCHIAFGRKENSKRKRISATAYDNMTATECQLLVLRDLRPSAYSRILNSPDLVPAETKERVASF